MACFTRDINYNPVHALTAPGPHNSDDDDEFDGYVNLQDYTHSSIEVRDESIMLFFSRIMLLSNSPNFCLLC